MDLKLEKRTALVMGASSGLGRAVAERLVQEGAKVAICSRSEARINAAAKELGAKLPLVADLSVPDLGRKVVDQVLSAWGSLDILVVNTGGPPKGPFLELGTSEWQTGFQGLWLSAVDAIRAAVPSMRSKGWGRILLITSVAAKEPMPGLTVSSGLRAGLLGLAKSISNEVAEQGITVNCLLPGYTDTERVRELGYSLDKMLPLIPAKRLGRPEELGALAAFLSSELAGYVTGQAIAVDGGYLHGHGC